MLPTTDADFKKIYSELIKKQMLVLGPDITLAKVKNVSGITVDNNGEVQSITGDPQQLLQLLINQFVELSGTIVKKTMESILTSYPGVLLTDPSTQAGMGMPVAPQVVSPQTEAVMPQPVINPAPIQVDKAPEVIPQSQSHETPQVAVPQQTVDAAPQSKDDKEPPQFSQNQIEELNRALEELSKSPLSAEVSQK